MPIGYGFILSDMDDGADAKYYGYIEIRGAWYIMRETTSDGTFRYARGGGNYATNWTNRASLTYGYFSEAA